MMRCVIGWRTFLAVLSGMPEGEVATWLNRFSFDEAGAILIENGQDLETHTALLSAFVPTDNSLTATARWTSAPAVNFPATNPG